MKAYEMAVCNAPNNCMLTWTNPDDPSAPVVTSIEAVWNSATNRFDLEINGTSFASGDVGAVIVIDGKLYPVDPS